MSKFLGIGLVLLLLCTPAHADVTSALVLLAEVLSSAGYTYWAYAAYAVAAVSAVYGATSARRKAKRAAARARAEYNASLQDRTVSVLRSDPPWRVIYGECVVGGTIVDMFSTDNTNSKAEDGSIRTKADGLKHLVMVIAAHECEAVTDIYLDGVSIGALNGQGWATSAAAGDQGLYSQGNDTRRAVFTGSYTPPEAPLEVMAAFTGVQFTGTLGDANDGSSTWQPATVTISGGTTLVGPPGVEVTVDYRVASTKSSIRVSINLGSDTQPVDSFLNSIAPDRYTVNHRLRGMCYATVTLDLEDQRFQGGPPNLTFRVKGRKVYDPRTTTTAWSANPALIVRDFLMAPWGGECTASEVNNSFVIAAANACDVPINLTVGSTTETNKPRYTCNGSFTTEENAEAVLDDLLESMAGFAVYGAEWQIVAGAWTVPIMTLTDADLSGQIEVVQADVGLDELFNGVRGQYIPAGTGTPVDFEPYTNSTFVTDDGKPLWTNNDFPYTDHKARARNLARVFLERARNGQVLKYPAKIKAWPLQVGDRVTLSSALYGITSKVYRVTDWSFGVTNPVTLILEEDTEGTWDQADATVADPTPNTDLQNPWKVEALAGVTAASGNAYVIMTADGTVIPRVRVAWTAVEDALVNDGGQIEVLWRYAGNITWERLSVNGGEAGAYIIGPNENRTIIIEVRAVNRYGVIGPSQFVVHSVTGKTQPPGNVTGLAYTLTAAGIRVTWNRNTEIDYEATELSSFGATYGTSTVFWRGNASEATFVPPAGSYNVFAVHVNSSGIKSTTPATFSITGYSPVTAASVLTLSVTGMAFIYDNASATTTSSPTVTITANLVNLVGTATFTAEAFNAAGTSLGTFTLGGSGNTRTMTSTQFNSLGALTTKYVRVTASLSGYSDTVTIYRADGGSDAILMVLGNEAHTVPTDANGNSGVFSGATTSVLVFQGLTDVTSLWTHSIVVSNCTATINGNTPPGNVTGTGTVNVAVTAMTADAATVTITSSRSGYPTQSRVFSLSKSKAGVDPITGYLTNENVSVPAFSDGSNPTYTNAGGNFKAFRGTTDITTGAGTVYSISGGTDGGTNYTLTVNGLTMTLNKTTGAYTLSGSGWSTDSQSFTLLATNGSSVITKVYTITKAKAGANAQYVTIAGDQAFKYLAGSSTPTATSITLTASLFGGLTVYDWEYWTGSAWVNLSGTQNAVNYTLTHSQSEWGSATSLRVRCFSGSVFDEVTIVKLYDGAAGTNAVSGFLTNENVSVPTASDGTGATFSTAGGTFRVFNGTSDVTSSSAFAFAVGGTDNGTTFSKVQNGLTLTINKTSGVYALSGSSWSTDSESFTITAVFSGVTITKVYTISKAKAGVNGSNGVSTYTLEIFSSGLSATPTSTTATYNFSTDTFTQGNLTAGWSRTRPSASGTTPIYVSRQVVTTSTPSVAVSANAWTTPVIDSQNGTNGTRTAVLRLYQWSSSRPTSFPSGSSSYDWTARTYTLPGTPNGWTLEPGAPSPNTFLWVVEQSYSDQATTSPSTVTWSASSCFIQGSTSADNNSAPQEAVYVGKVFLRQASKPSMPAGGSYNFETSTLTPPSGWSATEPSRTTSATTPTWAVEFTFVSSTPFSTVTAGAWSEPTIVHENDGNGATNNVVVLDLFCQSAALPVAPTATTATYTLDTASFSAGDLTSSPAWGTSRPNPTSSLSVYRSQVRLTTTSPGAPTNITAVQALSAPALVARKGQDTRPPIILNAATVGITGVAWSDGAANQALRNYFLGEAGTTTSNTNINKLGDQVTITQGTTSTTKTWNGSSWGVNTVYFPGDVLSGGTIGATVSFNTDGYIIAKGATSISVNDPSTGTSAANNVVGAFNTNNNDNYGVFGTTNSSTRSGVYAYNANASNGYALHASGFAGMLSYARGNGGFAVVGRGKLSGATSGGGGDFEATGAGTTALRARALQDFGTLLYGNAFECNGKSTFTDQVTLSLAVGTAPLVVTSTTKVANLNVDRVDDIDFGAIAGGSTSAAFSFNYPGDVASQTNTWMLITVGAVQYYIPIWKKTA